MATIRQNFHEESEAAINKLVNLQLNGSYVYQSMVNFNFKKIKINYLTNKFFSFSTSGSIARMLHYLASLNFSKVIQMNSVNMLKNL